MAAGHRLLTVHAHPDDESSKGAATVARAAADGARTVLVCCTGGEAGDVLNPAMDTPEVRADLPAVRAAELERAAAIIGYDEVAMLGYRDSGMPGTPENEHPDCFARAPLSEAAGRLAAILRVERPHVVVTYGDEQAGYPHPDHLRVHDVTLAALDLAVDPAWGDGEPWDVPKLYYTVWAKARVEAMHEAFLARGLESPYDEAWFERPWQDHRITTQVPTDGFADVRWDALLAHATQVDPASPFWFGLPREVVREIHPWDDYIRARSTVPVPDGTEDDLFAGVDPTS